MKGGAHVTVKVYYVCGFPISDDLMHSGIPGMKWGVRRYQNLDGTLTPAGKERYYGTSNIRTGISKYASKTGNTVKSIAKKYVDHVKLSIKKRHPWLMNDEELNSVVNRMNMEKKMRDLKKDEQSSKAINRILKDSGDIAVNNARNFGQQFSSTAGRLIAENMFKRKKDDNGGGKKKNKGNNNGGNDSNGNGGKKRNKGQNQQTGNSQGGDTYIYNIYNGKAKKGKK